MLCIHLAARGKLHGDQACHRMCIADGAKTLPQLASGQSPKAIVLACSDSRSPPELIFDQGLGDLFIVRQGGFCPIYTAAHSTWVHQHFAGITMTLFVPHD